MNASGIDGRGHVLTMKEAAAYANVSEQTVKRWIRDEGLPKLQPTGRGGAVRIDPDELDDFLARDSGQRLRDRVAVIKERRQEGGSAGLA
jgi:excisionase family DNA binding protein